MRLGAPETKPADVAAERLYYRLVREIHRLSLLDRAHLVGAFKNRARFHELREDVRNVFRNATAKKPK